MGIGENAAMLFHLGRAEQLGPQWQLSIGLLAGATIVEQGIFEAEKMVDEELASRFQFRRLFLLGK